MRLILLDYHNFEDHWEFGCGWNIWGDMNKTKNPSGETQALIPVRIYVSILEKNIWMWVKMDSDWLYIDSIVVTAYNWWHTSGFSL